MNRSDKQPNIPRAIRRARGARAALRSRRRRLLAIAACASLALVVPAALSLGAFGSSDVVHAAVAQAQNLIDMLDQRSPGERTQAELTKTKRARVAAAARRPIFTTLVDQPIVPPGTELPLELAVFESPPALVDIGQPIAALTLTPSPSIGGILAPSPGTSPGTSPGISPGNSPGRDSPKTFPTTQPQIVVPTPAVPEPGTWMMMILGFGLVGLRLRRGKNGKSTLFAVR